MRIGLIKIEPKIINTAYMLISQYHKQLGGSVGWWHPLTAGEFDHVYCSSLFDFTDKAQVPECAITGGTGFDVSSRLPQAIEACEYDYSLYPKCETSYVWFSRGCDRDCPWCVVRQKEGQFHKVRRKQLNPKGKYLTIMDNDFSANPDWADIIRWIGNMPVDIQSIDVRKLSDRQCFDLAKLRQWKKKQFKIAWDNPAEDMEYKLVHVTAIIPARKLMCYVLIGYNSTPAEDMFRIQTLKKLRIDSFVMPYKRGDLYQDMFSQWVNRKAVFKTKTWKQYQQRKLGRIVFK